MPINLKKSLVLLCFCFYAKHGICAHLDKEAQESLKCSRLFAHFEQKYQIPRDTLHSIALKESGKAHSEHKIQVVWPWSVNIAGQGHYFNNKKEAVAFVKQQLKLGKASIDVGCMQINLKAHPAAFTTIEQAFDPEINVNYGAEFLKLKYNNAQDWHQAIAYYHSMTPEIGTKYKQEVIKIASKMPEYKNNLKKYFYAALPNGENSNYWRYASFSKPTKSSKVIYTAKSYHKNPDRWRSNLMVTVPKYKS